MLASHNFAPSTADPCEIIRSMSTYYYLGQNVSTVTLPEYETILLIYIYIYKIFYKRKSLLKVTASYVA